MTSTKTSTKFPLGALLMLLLISIVGDQSGIAAAGPSQQAVQGTWSGTFRTSRPNVFPFMVTLVITPNMHGYLINEYAISSYCLLKDVDLYVTVNGSNASIAGTDEDGKTITFEGTINTAGRVLTLDYVINGSATGKCESDDGMGNLEKR